MMDNKTKFNLFSFTTISLVDKKIAAQSVLYSNTEKYIKDHLEDEINKEVEEFNKKDLSLIPPSELKDFTNGLSDYYGLTHETKMAVSNYMIVATFSEYEKGLKKILSLSGKLTEQELKSCFRVAKIVEHIQNKFGVNYSDLDGADQIEELRCLNNSIKHNGIVGDQLVTSNPKWVKGQNLENTYDDFLRLKSAPINTLKDLSNKIGATL